jgi:hypothetical protein
MQVYECWLHTTIGNIFKNFMFVLDLHSCEVNFFGGKKSKFSSENITMLWSQYKNKLNMKVVGWRLIYMIINKKRSNFFVLLLQSIKQQWVTGDPMAVNGNLGHRWPILSLSDQDKNKMENEQRNHRHLCFRGRPTQWYYYQVGGTIGATGNQYGGRKTKRIEHSVLNQVPW